MTRNNFDRRRHKRIEDLKREASDLGLTPYVSLYGDRRQLATWEKLLGSASELQLLPKRTVEKLSDRAQINWKLAIALFVSVLSLILLLQPLRSKIFPVKITIQIGAK